MLSAVAVNTPSTLSVAVAVPIATGVNAPVATADTSAGAVTTGAPLSFTVTACVAVLVLPALSVALHVTIVVPKGYGPALSIVGVTAPSTLSTAVATPSCAEVIGLLPPFETKAASAGAVISGGVVSTILIVTVSVELTNPSKTSRDISATPSGRVSTTVSPATSPNDPVQV